MLYLFLDKTNFKNVLFFKCRVGWDKSVLCEDFANYKIAASSV